MKVSNLRCVSICFTDRFQDRLVYPVLWAGYLSAPIHPLPSHNREAPPEDHGRIELPQAVTPFTVFKTGTQANWGLIHVAG